MTDPTDYHEEVQRLQDERRKLRGLPKRADRITMTEVLRVHLAKMLQPSGEHSTVRLARNAKGDTQIEVSVRTGESEDVRTVEDAAAKAREVYDALAMLYRMSPPDEDEKRAHRQGAALARRAAKNAAKKDD